MLKSALNIPGVMVTQHPDNANKPFWQDTHLTSSSHEIEECYISYKTFGAGEYKWDWEGKFTTECFYERLLYQYADFFQKNILGKNFLLTPRLPNYKSETEFRMSRALTSIVSAAALAKHLSFKYAPITEAILPVTESAREILRIQEAYQSLATLKHSILKHTPSTLPQLNIIPLFESVEMIIQSSQILEKYINIYSKTFGEKPAYIRPFIARSDPAIHAGLPATVLSAKIALSDYHMLTKKCGILFYPLIGVGSLPFRGGLTPYNVDEILQEYAGVHTLTAQSAFRYDYPLKDAIQAIQEAQNKQGRYKAVLLSAKEKKALLSAVSIFKQNYAHGIPHIAPLINALAPHMPQRRERLKHIGILSYTRVSQKQSLPRAITFTGSLYSLGIPPEIIGLGRAINECIRLGIMDTVVSHYKRMKKDIVQAGKYLNRDNLFTLAKTNPFWQEVGNDIIKLEKYFDISLGGETKEEQEHIALSVQVLQKIKNNTLDSELLNEAAQLRKSIG